MHPPQKSSSSRPAANGRRCGAAALRPAILLAALVTANAAAQVERVSVGPAGVESDRDSYQASINDDGSVIAFRSNSDLLDPADSNGLPDIFVREVSSGTTERVSPDFTSGQLQLYN